MTKETLLALLVLCLGKGFDAGADSIAFEQDALGKSCGELAEARSTLAKQVRIRRDLLPDFLLGDGWETNRESFRDLVQRNCFRKLSLRRLDFPKKGCIPDERRDDGKAIADDLRGLMPDVYGDMLLESIGIALQQGRSKVGKRGKMLTTKRDAGRAIRDLLSVETFQDDLTVVSKVFREKNCGNGPIPDVTVEEL